MFCFSRRWPPPSHLLFNASNGPPKVALRVTFLIFHPANRGSIVSEYFQHFHSCVYLFVTPHSQRTNRGPLHYRRIRRWWNHCMVTTVRRNPSLKVEDSFMSHQGPQTLRKFRPVYCPITARRSSATARRKRGSTTWMCIVHIHGWHDCGHCGGRF